MRRIGRGWDVAKRSMRVLRGNPSLATFPVVSAVAVVVAFGVLVAPGLVLAAAEDTWWLVVPFAIVAGYAATYCAVYFNVALAGAVAQSLDGRTAGLRDGLEVARGRRVAIARWSLVAATVGLLLQAIYAVVGSDNPVVRAVAMLVAGGGGAAWAAATFFVMPVLAFEGLGPKAALARSAGLVRERWGEGAVGTVAIGGAVLVAGVLPAGALAALGVAASGSVAIAAFAAAVVILIVAATLGTALSAIFRVVLYRFVDDGWAVAGFDAAELDAVFGRPRARPAV
jgi:Family of unknown function (DUF6159)